MMMHTLTFFAMLLRSPTLAGISSVSNIIKSYEMRTGKPKEMGYDRS